MKFLLRPALATAVLATPYLLVMAAGFWWLYERGYFFWWAVCAALLLLLGRGLVAWSARWRRAGSPSGIEASPDWSPESDAAWKIVEAFAERARREPPPLETPEQFWNLAKELLDEVARHYHPESTAPLLETPALHIAKLTERVAGDLGDLLSRSVPGSHVLTIRQLWDLKALGLRAHGAYSAFYGFYRWARLLVNPPASLAREIAYLTEQDVTSAVTLDLASSLLDFAIRRTGHYAIELYSGQVMRDATYQTRQSRADEAAATTAQATMRAEPLRILIVGQVSAGKSSLINALFGQTRAATDVLPTTRNVQPLIFDRPGFGPALIFDTAGYGGASDAGFKDGGNPFAELADELLTCDLTLLVCSAMTAARASDRRMLDALREEFQRRSKRRPPPLLVALTHVDLLRPFNQWNPPYDVSEPTSEKARQIAAAIDAVATELEIDPAHVIPVCLLPERLYNIEEGVLPALFARLPDAARAKALRCLDAAHHEERWRLLWRQALSAGRILRAKVLGR